MFSLSCNSVFMFENSAICSHILELASEASACWCPLILITIGVFSYIHFVESDY